MSTTNKKETVENSNENERSEIDRMRDILSSIASEMQRFHDSTFESDSEVGMPEFREKQNVFGELLKCKSKIKSKRVCIKKLKKNLETACSVAKIVASAKEKECGSHKLSSDSAQTENSDVMQFQNNNKVINHLRKENAMLNNRLDNVASFIRLGYEELQKIRGEPAEEKSVFEQLRKLIICCGQYYADYRNEHDECLHLRQKNNFLTNKSLILGNSVDALSQQLKTLQYSNFRLQKDNDLFKDRVKKSKGNELEIVVSEISIESGVKDSLSDKRFDSGRKRKCNENEYKPDYENYFDLSPHLTIVKKLLHCQDTLLKDLKCLSDEFLNIN